MGTEPEAIKKVLREVHQAVAHIVNNRERMLRESEIMQYDRCIERLRDIGWEVSEYELLPEHYVQLQDGVSYVGGTPSGRRVSHKVFDVRAGVLLGTLAHEIRELEKAELPDAKLGSQLFERRFQLLHLLIRTHLVSNCEFPVFHGDGRIMIANLDTSNLEFAPTVSDLKGLADQQLIGLEYGSRGSVRAIHIPTHVLRLGDDEDSLKEAVYRGGPNPLASGSNSVTNHYYASGSNVAVNSSNFEQNMTTVQLETVFDRIDSALGTYLTDEGAESLKLAITADARETGSPTFGASVGAWIANATSSAAGTWIVAGAPPLIGLITSIFQ